MCLSGLERAVLSAIGSGGFDGSEVLGAQLQAITNVRRELDGVGLFLEIEVDGSRAPSFSPREAVIHGVSAQIDGLDYGAGFLLFISGGYMRLLDGFSFSEPWPVVVDGFRVFVDECGFEVVERTHDSEV